MTIASHNARVVEFGEIDTERDDPFAEIRKRVSAWKSNSTLLLFDARHAAYRAIHTREGLTDPNGRNTCGLHGFLEIVGQACDVFKSSKFIVVWDGGVEAKRVVHPFYKSRQDKPSTPEEVAKAEEIRAAMKVTVEGTTKIGLPSIKFNEFEADDIIGYLSREPRPKSIERVVIVSDDKDFYQLIRPDVFIWRGITKRLVGPEEFRAEFPFEPEKYVDFKALVGEPETGDNIPGVAGFGPGKAAKYIGSHGDLGSAIHHAKLAIQVAKPKPLATDVSLASSEADAWLSYKLSKIAVGYSSLRVWGSEKVVDDVMLKAKSMMVSVSKWGPSFTDASRVLRGTYGFSPETCEAVLRPMGYR